MTSGDMEKAFEQAIEAVRPHLAGLGPELQGAVLCDLLATWLAGHPPQMRHMILDFHLSRLWEFVEVNDKIIFGDTGHPGKKEEKRNG